MPIFRPKLRTGLNLACSYWLSAGISVLKGTATTLKNPIKSIFLSHSIFMIKLARLSEHPSYLFIFKATWIHLFLVVLQGIFFCAKKFLSKGPRMGMDFVLFYFSLYILATHRTETRASLLRSSKSKASGPSVCGESLTQENYLSLWQKYLVVSCALAPPPGNTVNLARSFSPTTAHFLGWVFRGFFVKKNYVPFSDN